jgi:hypothetical protein
MANNFLEEHNAYRAEVGRKSLVWDAARAQVNKCTLRVCTIWFNPAAVIK